MKQPARWRRVLAMKSDWIPVLGVCGLLLAGGVAAGTVPPLPMAVSNNAVAALVEGEDFRLFSFLGLGPGKTWTDITNRAFEYDSRSGEWREIAKAPGAPRLASTAVALRGAVYLMGGYTVAEDGSEKSDPGVYRYDPDTQEWRTLAPMPVPVDDSVSLAYAGRYIYLVSGWHDTDNVDNVQVYDIQTDSWQQATPYPGAPVFGQAGGMEENRMIVCDGVKVVPLEEGKREFRASEECWLGTVDTEQLTKIDWEQVSHHAGPPLYRMGAAGTHSGEDWLVFFAGGSDNPYNYNGTGYDGEPSQPSAAVFSFDLKARSWKTHTPLTRAVMDLRGLPEAGRHFFVIGGMTAGQAVSDQVQTWRLDEQED